MNAALICFKQIEQQLYCGSFPGVVRPREAVLQLADCEVKKLNLSYTYYHSFSLAIEETVLTRVTPL